MAIRLFVQASPNIRASVSTRGLRIVAPEFRKPAVSVAKAVYQLVADYSRLQPVIAYQKLASSVHFQNVVTTNLALNPNALNRYLRGDTFIISDLAYIDLGRSITDSFAVSDEVYSAIGKSLSDTATVTEVLSHQLSFARNFSHSVTMLDVRPDIEVGINRTETLSTSDAVSKEFGNTPADAVNVSDASYLALGRSESETVTASDVFTRVVTYSRAFTDAFSVDDNATVGGVEKETQGVKTNIVAMSEEHTYAFSKASSDSFSVVEVTARSVGKSLTDSFGFTETVSIQNVSTASSVLNAGALNTVPFNN